MLLTSKIPPLNSYKHGFADTFFDLMSESEKVRIAVGYISADSVMELQETLIRNQKQKRIELDLVLGMHFYEGLTHTQLEAVTSLNKFVTDNNLGDIKVSNRVKFHGKVYCFYKNGFPSSCLVGSSNLNNITASHSSFEVDLLSKDKAILLPVEELLNNLSQRAAIPISEWETPSINKIPSPLEGYGLSEKISDKELPVLVSKKTNISFDIPLKTKAKSSLNVFFGKGREAKNGFIIPRPWYEVELIVPNTVYKETHYPKGDFTVVTEDGWKFGCKTSGDNCKNLRSTPDLQILGRWLKGAMENKGILKVGEPVTDETLKKFGKTSFKLTKTTEENLWLAEF